MTMYPRILMNRRTCCNDELYNERAAQIGIQSSFTRWDTCSTIYHTYHLIIVFDIWYGDMNANSELQHVSCVQ